MTFVMRYIGISSSPLPLEATKIETKRQNAAIAISPYAGLETAFSVEEWLFGNLPAMELDNST